jgi:hypothetical protein
MAFASFAAPGELSARRALEKFQFDTLKWALQGKYNPSILYRAMLFWTRRKGKKDGLAHFCFIEMFGISERWSDKGEPIYLDDPDFDEWMMLRELRNMRRWQREKAKRRKEKKLNERTSLGTKNPGEL